MCKFFLIARPKRLRRKALVFGQFRQPDRLCNLTPKCIVAGSDHKIVVAGAKCLIGRVARVCGGKLPAAASGSKIFARL